MQTKSIIERLRSGEILVADGATGTNLLERGLPRGVPSESWVFEKPDQIVQLHRDFIASGAQIILTATFGANPIRLEESELGKNTLEVNQAAVSLARQAIQDRPVLIAGSMGPIGKLLKPYGPIEPDDAQKAFAEQAQALTQSDVDLLIIETQFDLVEATAAVHGTRSVSSLPLIVSFSYDRGKRTMMGISPAKMASELAQLPVDMLGINCGRTMDDNLAALAELNQATQLPIWFKPNAGLPKVDELGNSFYDLPPLKMSAGVPEWIANGASIIGGCCGTTPEHLAAISTAVREKQRTSE